MRTGPLLLLSAALLALAAADRRLDQDFEFDDAPDVLPSGGAGSAGTARRPRRYTYDPHNPLCRTLVCKKREVCLLRDSYTALCDNKKDVLRRGDVIVAERAGGGGGGGGGAGDDDDVFYETAARGRARGAGRGAGRGAVRGVRGRRARRLPVRLRQPHLLVAVPPRPAQLRAARTAAGAAGVPRFLPVPGAPRPAAGGVRAGRDGGPAAGLVLGAAGGGGRRGAGGGGLAARLPAGGALDVRAPGRGRRRRAVGGGPVGAAPRRARALPAALPGVVRRGGGAAVARGLVRLSAPCAPPLRRPRARPSRTATRSVRAVVRRARVLPAAAVPQRAGRVLVRGRARRGAPGVADEGRAALPRRGGRLAQQRGRGRAGGGGGGGGRGRGARRRGRRRQRRRRAALLAAARVSSTLPLQ